MNYLEIFNIIQSINFNIQSSINRNDDIFLLKLIFINNKNFRIEFINIPIFDSKNDPRNYYHLKDEYEPIENYLIRTCFNIIKIMNNISLSIKPYYTKNNEKIIYDHFIISVVDIDSQQIDINILNNIFNILQDISYDELIGLNTKNDLIIYKNKNIIVDSLCDNMETEISRFKYQISNILNKISYS